MSGEPLPEEVKDLLLRHIDSVAHLEALLFLRTHAGESWEARTLAKRLYASETEMVAALAELGNDGFLVMKDGLYRYAPRPEHLPKIDALAKAYTHQLITITNTIHNGRRNIEAFSDAFKLRRDR
jgi:hypothetical protein